MTPVQSPSASAPTPQQVFSGLTARLTQLAKDPPDLLVYLRAHADCITTAFRPVGFAYDMAIGLGFQRLLHANVESLGTKESPDQENAFQRARGMALAQRKPLVLAPHTGSVVPPHGLAPSESPAPDELPIFNHTPYEQVFVPIPHGNAIAGVVHIWFQPTNNAASHGRLTLLRQLCGEMELYFRTRAARDASNELARLGTYARLLEEITGDISLDSVSWKLVNYAREAVGCERVCLFAASDYDRAVRAAPGTSEIAYQFRLRACSGLKRPHPRSEQAVTLQRVAQKLTDMSLAKAVTPDSATPEPAGSNGSQPPNPSAPIPKGPLSPAGHPKPQITLMMRDPSKTATRPAEVNDYFDVMPMNWATVIPLFDRQQHVCGILLFEGTKVEEKLSSSLKPMLDLAASAGKALGTALYCEQHRPIRLARRFIDWRHGFINTPAKRKWIRYGVPIFLVIGLLACPMPYSVKGNASILPVRQNTLPALVGARLQEVTAREGELVKQGHVLARFDTRDLQLQLAQAEQEYERSLVESDSALNAGKEAEMQIARLNADKAAAIAEKLRLDLSRAVVRAPFDGVVLGAQSLSTRIGEVLRVGEPALHVVDPSAWQVKAALKEKDLIFLGHLLQQQETVPASLRLAANPGHKYELGLNSPAQLAYGLDTTTGDYQFTAMLPLNATLVDADFLKSGFTGRMTFEAGMRPLAHILFKDFIDYLKVRFF